MMQLQHTGLFKTHILCTSIINNIKKPLAITLANMVKIHNQSALNTNHGTDLTIQVPIYKAAEFIGK